MSHSPIPVFSIGSGNAAHALASALALVLQKEGEMGFLPLRKIARGEAFPAVSGPSLLFIANCHALHADRIREADAKGFTHIVTEKPAVVRLDQIEGLHAIRAQVSVCHGYRQNWGPRKMREAIQKGELGRLIAVEGRYWQASAAARALAPAPSTGWKNDPALSGPHDVLLDLGTHWADLVTYLVGEKPRSARGRLSYLNAESPHRDTHVQLEIDYPGSLRTWGSVSKTVHGSGNELEVVAIGEKAVWRWSFESPDTILVGRGKEMTRLSRGGEEPVASKLPAHHALGWLEGYVSILTEVVRSLTGKPTQPVPTLKESLETAELLLRLDFTAQTP